MSTATPGDVPAAVFLFDERRDTFIDAVRIARACACASDWPSGRLSLNQIDPAELSPGEFAHRVRDASRSDGCRVVLIDSLNGYLNAIPDRARPARPMHELLAYLNDRGCRHAAGRGAARHDGHADGLAPIDVSYLADCRRPAAVLRGGRRWCARRSRSSRSAPAGTKRRFASWPSGRSASAVGEPLVAVPGRHDGVPQYRGTAGPLLHDDGRSAG